jgi:protein arginine N-methyltransferase 2
MNKTENSKLVQLTEGYDMDSSVRMIDACERGDLGLVQSMLSKSKQTCDCGNVSASLQDDKTGFSPLMMAAKNGHLQICHLLLENGAPWNAIDRNGKCAGNFATDNKNWDIVNLLVDFGTQAELVLSASIRLEMEQGKGEESNSTETNQNGRIFTSLISDTPVEHQPCTKPDYLDKNVRYNVENTLLLDDDNDAVMMEWERPLMDAHASILVGNETKKKIILNIGFGLGIIDDAIQKHKPSLHIIIEAHPGVHQKMIQDKWNEKENVRICFGRWQDELPKLIEEGFQFDGIFYDTYGEHFTDMEDFHNLVSKCLIKPNGVYSFFNGLAPDNIFFHGVACQCVKVQLAQMGLESEFARKLCLFDF